MFETILSDISKGLIQAFRKEPKLRNKVLIITPIIFVPCFGSILIFNNELLEEMTALLIVFGSVTFVTFLMALASFSPFKTSSEIIDSIEESNNKLIENIGNKDHSVANMVKLSLNNLKQHYAINLNHARTSYFWSIVSIIVGLITLITGIWILYFAKKPDITVGLISGVGGILIEFIGASYIYIYNKSISQLNIHFKQLIVVQDTMLAVDLCDKISDDNPKKIEIREKIILNLINRYKNQEAE